MARNLSAHFRCWLLGGMLSFVAATAAAQVAPEMAPQPAAWPRFDAALTYATASARPVAAGDGRFWLQGGGAELGATLYHGLGPALSFAGMHADNFAPGVSLGLLNILAGPRYRFTPHLRHVSVFAEGLLGVAHGFDSVFPSGSRISTSATSLAFELGGGVDLTFSPPLSRRLSVRVIQASWLRSQLPNESGNVQNNFLLQAGLVLHLGRR